VRAFLKYFSRYRLSALALIVVNMVPLVGVLFWRWNAFEIFALYWAENVAMGAINVLKMITCRPRPSKIDWDQPFTPEEMTALRETFGIPHRETGNDADELARLEAAIAKRGKATETVALPSGAAQPGSILTFACFYGGFCFLHGLIVYDMFGGDNAWRSPFESVIRLSKSVYEASFWPFMALAGSHLYSFVVNYLGRGEFRRVTIGSLTFQEPLARVLLLHVAILFSGLFFILLGSPLPLLVLLVIGKTAIDLLLHLRQRERNAGGDSGRTSAMHATSQKTSTGEADQLLAKRQASGQ
jgi:hypothetical protein